VRTGTYCCWWRLKLSKKRQRKSATSGLPPYFTKRIWLFGWRSWGFGRVGDSTSSWHPRASHRQILTVRSGLGVRRSTTLEVLRALGCESRAGACGSSR
jgi:hypothetical protein